MYLLEVSLLAQSWIREEQPEYNFILGVHKREPDHNKGRNVVLDYENSEELAKQFLLLKADIAVNCIGLTNVEACEEDEKLAAYTNVEIAQNIAQASKLSKVKLVHISTDHLFDGEQAFASEQDKKVPVNAYGRTKAKGRILYWIPIQIPLVIRTNFFSAGGQVTNLLFQIKS